MLDPAQIAQGAQASQTGRSVATSDAEESEQKLAEDLDQFLTLLTTQLKHQDPLDPLKPNEFTTQLVQFASVEQQIQSNKNLEQMLELQQNSLLGTLVGFIGSRLEANGNQLVLENGQAQATYELPERATSTTLSVRDEAGKVVFFTDGAVEPGKHAFNWNGTDNFGFPLEDGNYTLNVSAQDSEGNPVEVSQTAIGTVTGVSMDDGQAVLSMGGAEFTVDDIVSIQEDVEQETPDGGDS